MDYLYKNTRLIDNGNNYSPNLDQNIFLEIIWQDLY